MYRLSPNSEKKMEIDQHNSMLVQKMMNTTSYIRPKD